MRRLLLIALPLAALVAGSVALLAHGSEPEARTPGLGGGPYRGSETPGHIHETKCKEACPVIADQIDMGLARLRASERRGVYALAISTHPGDDTPSNVREFLRVQRIFDRQGTWVTTLHPGADLTPANLAHDVRVALRGS